MSKEIPVLDVRTEITKVRGTKWRMLDKFALSSNGEGHYRSIPPRYHPQTTPTQTKRVITVEVGDPPHPVEKRTDVLIPHGFITPIISIN